MAMLGARDTVLRNIEWQFEWDLGAVTRILRILRIFIKRCVFQLDCSLYLC